MPKRLFTLFCAGAIALLSACGAPTVGDAGPSQNFFAMDTVMTISLTDGTEDDLTAAVQLVNTLDAALTRSEEHSPLAAVNAAGAGTLTAVPDDLGEAVSAALSIAERTGGAFDPTLAPLIDLWGFSGEQPAVPAQAAINETLNETGWEHVTCGETAEGWGILFDQNGMGLDLGGIGKGYAAKEVTELLYARGVTSSLLDLGGNITALGTKKNGDSWQIAVQDPQDENSYLCILPLQDRSASTSGSYERYFEENGVRYSHILDPETGYPVENDLLSATVVCEDPVTADGLSTALFVLGREKALELWRESDDFECILVGTDGTVSVTAGLADTLQFQGAGKGYTCETVRR